MENVRVISAIIANEKTLAVYLLAREILIKLFPVSGFAEKYPEYDWSVEQEKEILYDLATAADNEKYFEL